MGTRVAGEQQFTADVAVVGAGPAGSMAALVLARAGVDVILIDRAAFPREKVCGDGLMPDAIAALRGVGLADAVLAEARRCYSLRIFAPDGASVAVRGDLAVLQRTRLDAILCGAAVDAGARLLAPATAVGPIEDGGRVLGVEAETDGAAVRVRAPVTVLATGASAGPLKRFGVCERSHPSATAARCYFTVDGTGEFNLEELCISYDRSTCPGYGWIFPGPGRTFNAGVGYFYDTPALPDITNLRHLMKRFLDTFPPARELMKSATVVSELRGAPLRTGLAGSALSRPGLLVAGDAAGLTYPISGEGIGKAMESGILAGETIAGAIGRQDSAEDVAREYAAAIRARFARRFAAYSGAQRWVAHPRMLNFLAWRANRGSYVRRQIEGLLNETAEPQSILSVAGILRSVFT